MEPILVEPAPPPKPTTVVIDPGHGGSDTGVLGVNGLKEKEVVLAVAERIVRLSEPINTIKIAITREARDVEWSDATRVNFTLTKTQADLFITLHTGASYSPTARGFELYIAAPTTDTTGSTNKPPSDAGKSSATQNASLKLAEKIATALSASSGASARGIRRVPFRILNSLNIPAVAIEIGVLTNPEDEKLLASDEFRDKIAQGILAGIQEYLAETGGSP
ncbi:MAG TPA: N-acetylmuramoyl-L-alanine amidase [Candidatus Hydrogenedentes bacterium]|nr:N-acetylmuramoyl-L-alanine amidase [Candidatus Hydrogenedentota bacterium]HOL76535.1 N-acetylmuramoyl-L-alanine amidase [Candidatus Hydrogenedentota bacterium]HPO85199.1 N-acetylmuramoyl-L-alanine amidase [Candidatus Hydrogenedentota bacterium]